MMEYEQLNLEEAELTYQQREKLPDSAFCGPNRTYPAYDNAHVKNALARLSQFGKNLKPATRNRILNCLKQRAKRMGIEVSESEENKADEILKWYLEEVLNIEQPCKDCDDKKLKEKK